MKNYTDINGKIIKVGDTLKDEKGELWTLQNISGVTMITQSDDHKITRTQIWNKVKHNRWEVVV